MTERARVLSLSPDALPDEQWEALFREYGIDEDTISIAMALGPEERTHFIEQGEGRAARWQLAFALSDGPRSPSEAAQAQQH